MLKSKLKKTSAIAMVCAIAVTGVATLSATASAAESVTGSTPVTYDNRQVTPEINGMYGFIIPTGISFSQNNKQANADIEITGLAGHELTDWKDLQVAVTITSEGTWSLSGTGEAAGSSAKYTTTYDGFKADTAAITGLKLTNSASKISATANLVDVSKAQKKGKYKDTINYSFEEIANKLK